MSLSVHIQQRRGDFTLNAEFEAPAGITALFGRSGAGKTSVVNAVAGLSRPDQGQIRLEGETLFDSKRRLDMAPHRRQMGYVFQNARLFPHLSVRGNLRYGQRFGRGATNGPSLDEVAALLGIEGLLARRPGALSGGEAQRVAIGRALLAQPRMLLMDEPLSSLDGPRKAELLPYIERLRDEMGLPILYVSHALPEVARLATTVVLLEQGQTLRAGPAAELLSDPDLVRHFGLREAGAILSARLSAHHPDGLSELALPAGRLLLPQLSLPLGQQVRVRILAKDVILSDRVPEGLSALNVLPGTVTALRDGAGPGMIAQLDCGGARLLARITRRSAQALQIAPGRAVHAVIKTVSVAQLDVGAGGAPSFSPDV